MGAWIEKIIHPFVPSFIHTADLTSTHYPSSSSLLRGIQGRIVCPAAAAEFSRCTHLVINHKGVIADTPDCTKPLLAMRKCLKRKGV